jgi:hypothetical protein
VHSSVADGANLIFGLTGLGWNIYISTGGLMAIGNDTVHVADGSPLKTTNEDFPIPYPWVQVFKLK